MRNYIAAIFNDQDKAFEALRALWTLDDEGYITVHGAAVVHRDSLGQVVVETKHTHPGLATAVGVGIGALLGSLAGPAGTAAGVAGAAAVTAGAGAAAGAAIGGTAGVLKDLDTATTHDQAAFETTFVLPRGAYAVIADVSEEWTTDIDKRMQSLGGKVFRRSKGDVREDAIFLDYPYDYYLYPYYYRPSYQPYELYA